MTKLSPNQRFEPVLPDPVARLDDAVVDFGAPIRTLWRDKWIIALTTLLSLAASGYFVLVLATPLYRATAVVMLETKQEHIVDLKGVIGGLSGDSSEVNSEVEVLRSRGLMGKVVDRLDLTMDPEFNAGLRPMSPMDVAKDRLRSLLGLSEPRVELPREMAAKRDRDSAINSLLAAISVRNVPLSLVFQVTAETESAEKSARIADAVVDLYVQSQLDAKFAATEKATTWLTGRVSGLRVQLEQAEQKLSSFTASTDLVSAESLHRQEVQLKELRTRIVEADNRVAAATARLHALAAADTRPDKAGVADDRQLDRFLPRTDSDTAIAAAFDARFAQLLTRAEVDVTRLGNQANTLRASEAELSDRIRRLGNDLIELQQYKREAEAIRLLYEYFLTRLNETAAQQGIQTADSRVLSRAMVPTQPSAPKKSLIMSMAGVLGVLAGAGVVLLREARNSGFRTARDLETHTGYSVLGQIPQIPARNRRRILAYLADKPTSAAAEAVRSLRTSVLMSNVDRPPRIILSTSAIPGEGKTTNSLALSQSMADLGKSVLLIEGDIRRRTVSRFFDETPKAGILNVLADNMPLQDAVFRPPKFRADILPGQKTNTNAADLFASDRFRSLLAEAGKTYDTVVIDAPPTLVVPDARIVAQHVDAVLFSVRWDRTSRQQVDEALRLFHTSNLRITGLIFSQINPRRMKAYGYGGRHGAFGGHGAGYYTN